ncbi:MAG TPA: hypothetical protein VJC01_01535 [Candidatus Paceibacterota bacterium]
MDKPQKDIKPIALKASNRAKVRILNKGNCKIIALTKESQGTMYYRGQ